MTLTTFIHTEKKNRLGMRKTTTYTHTSSNRKREKNAGIEEREHAKWNRKSKSMNISNLILKRWAMAWAHEQPAHTPHSMRLNKSRAHVSLFFFFCSFLICSMKQIDVYSGELWWKATHQHLETKLDNGNAMQWNMVFGFMCSNWI